MDRIMEWVFTANIHPYQVAALIVGTCVLYSFCQLCYGKAKGGR